MDGSWNLGWDTVSDLSSSNATVEPVTSPIETMPVLAITTVAMTGFPVLAMVETLDALVKALVLTKAPSFLDPLVQWVVVTQEVSVLMVCALPVRLVWGFAPLTLVGVVHVDGMVSVTMVAGAMGWVQTRPREVLFVEQVAQSFGGLGLRLLVLVDRWLLVMLP